MTYYSNHYIKMTPEMLRDLADDIETKAKKDGLANFGWITFRERDNLLEMFVEQPDAKRNEIDPYHRDANGSFTTYTGTEDMVY